jgi:hypothetical protein
MVDHHLEGSEPDQQPQSAVETLETRVQVPVISVQVPNLLGSVAVADAQQTCNFGHVLSRRTIIEVVKHHRTSVGRVV